MQVRDFAGSLVFALVLGLAGVSASANQEPAAAAGEEKPAQDVRKLFANSCSWCHGDFGMKEGKGGPRLAGTKLDAEQVKDRISNGKAGSMPGFKKTLKEDQIQALTEYVKSLPAN
ncbi:MAG TPA: cytochrome c [Burkholderiales bacterium]